MITLRQPADLNWETVEAVAYDQARLEIDESLLAKVAQGRLDFLHLIAQGVPCYGVTTGLGALSTTQLTAAEQADLPHHMLRARAAAVGPPLPKPVARATLMIRLVNFLSGLDGVSADLCRFVAARLNDDFTPWIPSLGHGIAADVTANCHAFQTFIGEGFVFGPDNRRQPAAEALAARGVEPYRLGSKEGLALLSGVTASPAYALDAYRHLERLLKLATMVAAVSMEGLAAPKDAVDPASAMVSAEPSVAMMIAALQRWLAGSRIEAVKLQAPVSYRVVPQVHGALFDALQQLRRHIERALTSFSDNPLMVLDESPQGGRLLSVGLFHNQHLVNQVEQVALALAHVGCLSERRLHRLLNPANTGLAPQLAARPGLDAGLVVAHKASLGLAAQLRLLAQPISLATGDSSNGQEDYMALALPAVARLYDMADWVTLMLAYELLAGLVALDRRGGRPGDGVEAVRASVRQVIPPLDQDRSPGPDVEELRHIFDSAVFQALLDTFG
ncbi:MAG: histidine ammonia-lyase [Anaerolineaceae bacterium]|nr:histidine ammonia-lyase [Anaerolineaceae bacterium]MCB9101291.1 histidine ammonia-lyase [Anaerolineales bacterium]